MIAKRHWISMGLIVALATPALAAPPRPKGGLKQQQAQANNPTQIAPSPANRRRQDGSRRGIIAEAARAVADRARELRAQMAADPELLAAQEAFRAAVLNVRDTRKAVDTRLRETEEHQPLVQAIAAAGLRLEELRKNAGPGDKMVFEASIALMNSRAAFNRVVAKAIDTDDDCTRARYDMLDAHARLMDAQDKLQRTFDTDSALRAARDALKQARSSRR